MPFESLPGNLLQADATDSRAGPGEIRIHDLAIQPDGLEELRPAVAAEGRDAHLAHRLEDALLDRGDVVVGNLDGLHLGRQLALPLQLIERLERHVRVDPVGPVAAQQAEVHHLAGLAALSDQAGLMPQALVEHGVMDRRYRQKRRDRGLGFGNVAVTEDNQRSPLSNGFLRRGNQRIQAVTQGLGRTRGEGILPSLCRGRPALESRAGCPRHVEQSRYRGDAEVAPPDSTQTLHVLVRQDRMRKLELPAMLRSLVEQVALLAREGHQAHHEPLAQGVDGRVRHLGEKLLEIAEQEPGSFREYRQRRVVAHGTDRLLAVDRHRRQDHLELFARIAEGPHPTRDRQWIALDELRGVEEPAQLDAVLIQPSAVGLLADDLALDLVVRDDPPLDRIDEEHASRAEPALDPDLLRRELHNARLAADDGQAVGRDQIPARSQAVAIQDAADYAAIGEDHGRRAVPRPHDRGMVLIECPLVRADMVLGPERLGDHHHHRVRQATSGSHEQFHTVVETGRVAAAGHEDWEQVFDVVTEQRIGHLRLVGPHVVAVAAEGVDLTVVGDAAEGLCQPPVREGVRAVSLMHDCQGRFDLLVREIRIVGE